MIRSRRLVRDCGKRIDASQAVILVAMGENACDEPPIPDFPNELSEMMSRDAQVGETLLHHSIAAIVYMNSA